MVQANTYLLYFGSSLYVAPYMEGDPCKHIQIYFAVFFQIFPKSSLLKCKKS